MVAILIIAAILLGIATLYFAWRSREFRKFLAGAFFVSGGTQFYFYINNVAIPLLGTNLVQTPEVSGVRSGIHFVLFLLCLYFGFIGGKARSSTRPESH
jgi:hypothetical protein